MGDAQFTAEQQAHGTDGALYNEIAASAPEQRMWLKAYAELEIARAVGVFRVRFALSGQAQAVAIDQPWGQADCEPAFACCLPLPVAMRAGRRSAIAATVTYLAALQVLAASHAPRSATGLA